ncbi:hypothetical protein pipiens_011524 [Culex pipiens pipiens]|uniref:Uncharacterized protein n=1 Tax=Culex pipiens pipiens TaxID=38569 RepID=A0ABD1D7F8_CULPP
MKLLAFLAVLLMGLSLVMVPGSASPADCPQVTRKPRNATTYKITSDMLQMIQDLASGYSLVSRQFCAKEERTSEKCKSVILVIFSVENWEA